MNCFSKFHTRKKGFHVVSPDSIKINLNEIYFKIVENEFITSYCKISLHTDPAYARFIIDSNETCINDSVDIVSKICESVVVTKCKGFLRLHNSQINIRLQYNPWLVTIYKGSVPVCLCKIVRDKVNKQRISFVSEMSGVMDVYGLAERASVTRLKHGQQYRLYNTDEFGLALGTDKPLYGSVPFIVGVCRDRCVGILCRNESDTSVRLTRQRLRYSCRQYWSHDAGIVDVVCLAENDGLKLRKSLLQLTGTTPLPPLFALGYHQCRWNYDNQEDVIKVDTGLREAGIPCDVVWLDIEHTDGKRYFTWDRDKFDPKALIDYLKGKGRHLVVIIDPHLKEDPEYHIYRESRDAGYLVKNEDGTTLIGECWPGDSAWVDYISDEASAWWTEKIFSYLRDFGSSGQGNYLWIWNDMNEPSVFKRPDNQMQPSALHGNGIEHRQIHNIYGQRMTMATWNGILKACDNNLRPFLLSRSFYTGSQKYGAIWTGDSICSWEHLRISVSMILSLSICGIDFCGADVGGFFGNPEPELLCRWYQLGAFQPFFRAHAHIESKRREPYVIEEPYRGAIKNAVCLRYNLLAYWYLCFWQAESELLPIVSPVWMHFPQYQKLDNDSAFMIGSNILVRPIVSPLCLSITIVLPGSKDDLWYYYCHISSRWQTCRAGENLKIPVNIQSIPVFYRGGHCFFMKESDYSNTEDWQHAQYHIVVFPNSRGSCSGLVYIDDYRTFAYKNDGRYTLHRCTFDCKEKSLSLETLHTYQTQDTAVVAVVTIGKITVVTNDNVSLSDCSCISFDNSDMKTDTSTIQRFQDRIEIINPEVELAGNWTMKIK